MRSQSVAEKIAKTFYEKLRLKTCLKGEEIYNVYFDCLLEAVQAGFNSTLLCPFMNDDPSKAANFHVQLINEIAFFTHIIDIPACLISGGSLDNSPTRNLDFLKEIRSNKLYTSDLTVFTISSNGSLLLFNGLSDVHSHNLQLGEEVLHEKPLELRGVLINSSNLRKLTPN